MFEDQQFKEKFLEEISWYPSGDNAQPFNFTTDSKNKLFIEEDTYRSKHLLDFEKWGTLLAFGALLEQIKIVSSQYGFNIKVTHNISPIKATIELFNEGNIEVDPLYPHLKKRQTDRRVFKKTQLSDELIEQINSQSHIPAKIKVRVLPIFDKKTVDYIAKADTIPFIWKDVFFDILRWVRFTPDEASQGDGLPWQNLGLKYFESLIIRAIRAFPPLFYLMKLINWQIGPYLETKKKLNNASAVVLFSAKDLETSSFIEMGKVILRSWIVLCKNGIGVQPHTASTLAYLFIHHSKNSNSIPTRIKKIYQNGTDVFYNCCKLPKDEFPLFIFRVGPSSPLPSEMLAKRRDPF